jgi:hypothetical protein
MSDGLTAPPSNKLNEETTVIKKPPRGKPSEMGAISKTIGTGDNAQNSIVWITIRWSLILGGLVSLALYLRPVYCQTDYSGSLVEDIKATWDIFMPIITLALGYVFGKGK